jgi:DNA gyrase inhibitor GyrI
MHVKIENIFEQRLAYIRKIGPYGRGNIEAMEQLKVWAKKHDLLGPKSVILGLVHDNPEVTRPDYCRYDICIRLPEKFKIESKDVHEGIISGGKYAVVEIDHKEEALQEAWAILFQTITSKGYSFDDKRPIIERYKAEMVNHHRCELCLPINGDIL